MCSLSFVPTARGYLVAMNRDELRTRPAALPSQILAAGGDEVIYPREISGGAWIACNADGTALALLNWNVVESQHAAARIQTRGAVIPRLIAESGFSAVNCRLHELDLEGMLPFRLVGIFRSERKLFEWRWEGAHLEIFEFAWMRRHWFSSSISDALAEQERSRVCEAAAQESCDWNEAWLAKLHSSHVPEQGAYSICMHRPDASTVSQTVIRCTPSAISMLYTAGNPCTSDYTGESAAILIRATHPRALTA